MKNFTKLISTALLCLLAILPASNSYSTHAQSADITYSCVSGNTFNLKLSFYRDCAGVAAPNSVTINISSASCSQNFDVTLFPDPNTGQDVTTICAGMATQCNNGTYPGVQEWVYSGNITLPAQCTDWVFSFSLCCRNNAISTINNPGGEDIYVEAQLDNLNFVCNNSPQFSNKPVPFICVNQSYCFNHGAVDADGDSLVYELVPPATGPGTTVTYLAGFSETQPLISSPAVSISPFTGDICMTPTQLDVTVMAVKVTEYRNGVIVGSVIRDIQVRVINCTNTNPYISGINGTNSYSTTTCAGSPLVFDINTFDADASQDVTITWNNAITGATFTSSGGSRPTGTFSWTPAVNDISSVPYCFTVTVADNNCPLNGTQTFSFCIVVTGFGISISTTDASCGTANGSATVTTTGGNAPFQYNWPNGGNSSTANNLYGGSYSVTVIDAAGCSVTQPFTINQNSSPATLTTNAMNVSCYNGSDGAATVNVTGGVPPYTYSWSNGGNSSAITGLTAGNYSVTVTTADGCAAIATISVTQPSAPLTTTSTSVNVSCNGNADGLATVNPSGGTGPYSFSWNSNPPQYTSTAQNLPPGNYSVIIMDSEGCTINSEITITQPAPIVINQNLITPPTCAGYNNGAIQVSASGGAGSLSYTWNTVPVQYGSSANGLFAGNYSVTVADANGCNAAFSYNMTEPAPLNITLLNQSDVTCSGLQNGHAMVAGNGGTPPYSYFWNTSPNQFTSYAYHLQGGVHTVTVTDIQNCSENMDVTINEPSALSASTSGAATICPGTSTPVSVTVSGGTSPYQYNWNNGLGNAAAHNVSPSVTSTYSVEVIDANGCITSAPSIPINVNDITAILFEIISSEIQICEGEPVSVEALLNNGYGNYSISWDNGFPNSFGPHTTVPDESGYYTATIIDDCNNARTESVYVTVNERPEINILPQYLESCKTAEATFFNSLQNIPGSFLFWDFGDGSTQTGDVITHYYDSSGVYSVSVTATTIQGCSDSAQTTVSIVILPSASADFNSPAGMISEFYPEVNFVNTSTGADSYSWNFGDGNYSSGYSPHHTYAHPGEYTVTLIANNEYNCPDTAMRIVKITREFTVFAPNAFTPDGDGLNDEFLVKASNVSEIELFIFNRWGEQIFYSNDMNKGWDGSFRNDPVKPDVYVYKIVARDDVNGDNHIFTGSITLLK